MKLAPIFKKLLKEQEEEERVISFPGDNFAMSLFRDENKLTFNPVQNTKPSHKIRQVINQIKQNFKVSRVQESKEKKDMWELYLDPAEKFDSVVDFIKNEVDKQRL